MITEQDLQAAIAECEGIRNPNANTCLKLAAFYTIQNRLYPQETPETPPQIMPEAVRYSGAAAPDPVVYTSDSDFGRIIKDHDLYDVFIAIDDLLEAVKVLNPRLYAGFLRRFDM